MLLKLMPLLMNHTSSTVSLVSFTLQIQTFIFLEMCLLLFVKLFMFEINTCTYEIIIGMKLSNC